MCVRRICVDVWYAGAADVGWLWETGHDKETARASDPRCDVVMDQLLGIRVSGSTCGNNHTGNE